MGDSLRANSVSEDTGCDLSVNNLSCERSSVENKECIYCYMKETAEITPLEAHSLAPVNLKDDLVMQEVEIAVGALHDEDLGEHLFDQGTAFDQDEVRGTEEIKDCQESQLPVSLDAKKQKGLGKSATFPCSVKALSCAFSVDSSDGASIMAQVQCLSTSESPAYARSLSFPASFKLVSAMKGGRAQKGMPPASELRVKWAPDVYDPLDSSMSHTVKKSHYQRPKAKKKDKHRHHKAKSSRGSGSEKKHSNRNGMGDMPEAMDTRPPPAGGKLRADGYGKSNAEVLDYAVGGQESTCGSSFLREALAKVHLSIAEAS